MSSTSEKTLFRFWITIVKENYDLQSKIAYAGGFNGIKLTNHAIYSYMGGFLPVGKILLENIEYFKIINPIKWNYYLFILLNVFLKQGVFIRYREKNEIGQVVIFVRKNKMDAFVNTLKRVGLKQRIQ